MKRNIRRNRRFLCQKCGAVVSISYDFTSPLVNLCGQSKCSSVNGVRVGVKVKRNDPKVKLNNFFPSRYDLTRCQRCRKKLHPLQGKYYYRNRWTKIWVCFSCYSHLARNDFLWAILVFFLLLLVLLGIIIKLIVC